MAIDFLVYERCPHCGNLNVASPKNYCELCGEKFLPRGETVVKLLERGYPHVHTLAPHELNDLLGELAGLFNWMSPPQVRDIQAKIDKIIGRSVDVPA